MSYAARYRLTKSGLQRRLREERCIHRLAAYIPWILVHELSSSGWSTRAWSESMQRIVHLLSRLEYLYFLRLEFSPMVKEFYEQFALPFEITKKIAKMLNIPYPRDPHTQEEIVMTSDFLIYTRDGRRLVRSVKPSDKLESERVRQKLKIEQVYWTQFDEVDHWGTVSREQMCPGIDWNINWVGRLQSTRRLPSDAAANVDKARPLARAWLVEEACTLRQTAERLGEEFGGLRLGTLLLRHLLASGALPEADFSVRFDLNNELPLLAERRMP